MSRWGIRVNTEDTAADQAGERALISCFQCREKKQKCNRIIVVEVWAAVGRSLSAITGQGRAKGQAGLQAIFVSTQRAGLDLSSERQNRVRAAGWQRCWRVKGYNGTAEDLCARHK